MLCPLHIPVLLAGFILGAPWGGAVGFIAPLFRALTLGMPPLFPTAIAMSLELATYGTVSGLAHKLLPKKKPFIYLSLLVAMLLGRVVWGLAMLVCLGATGGAFTVTAFLAGAFVNAVPGIILQLVLVPIAVMLAEDRVLKFSKK